MAWSGTDAKFGVPRILRTRSHHEGRRQIRLQDVNDVMGAISFGAARGPRNVLRLYVDEQPFAEHHGPGGRDLWGERSVRSVANLTREDGREFLELAQRVPVETQVTSYPLERAKEALADRRAGRFSGAAVLVP